MKMRRPVAAIAIVALCAAGCGPGVKTVVGKPAGDKHIAKIQAVWVEYQRKHKKPASSAADLKSFIETMSKDQLDRMQITDKAAVFVSDRDQQPYVVQKPQSRAQGIVIYEKTGKDGKHMAVNTQGDILELDDNTLSEALGKAP